MKCAPVPKRSKYRRLALLTDRSSRNFRIFYVGYLTSLLGSAMSRIALTFAVLGAGGSATDLGFVFAASVVPTVAFLLAGGVLADRLGRRPVMLGTDAGRLAVQAGLAVALFAGRPATWVFAVAAALLGAGDAFFAPALGGLTPQIAPAARLADANALLSVAQSAANVAGPALAGLLIAVTSPAAVVAVDAGTFGVSVIALSRLRMPPPAPPAPPVLRAAPRTSRAPRVLRAAQHDLADGWTQFRAQTWLWVTTLQFALFNLLSWAPYLLLGPIIVRAYLGGAPAWGSITAALAGGAILTGALGVGRRPRRPLVAANVGTFGYAAPCLALALHAPLGLVAAAAALAGAGSTTFGTYFSTVMQQRVAPDMLARTTAYALTGAYALGAVGYAVIGPIAGVLGARTLLGVAAGYAVLSSAAVLAVPAIRYLTWRQPPDWGAGQGKAREGGGE
jgi:MFS family permease